MNVLRRPVEIAGVKRTSKQARKRYSDPGLPTRLRGSRREDRRKGNYTCAWHEQIPNGAGARLLRNLTRHQRR